MSSVNAPPASIWPFARAMIANGTPLKSGLKFVSRVPSALNLAMKLRCTSVVDETVSTAVKYPPARIWPLDWTARLLTCRLGDGLKLVSTLPSELSLAR